MLEHITNTEIKAFQVRAMGATATAPLVDVPVSALPESDSVHHLVTLLARKAAVAFDMSYSQARDNLNAMNRLSFLNFYCDWYALENRLRKPTGSTLF